MKKLSVTANGLVADLFTGDTARPRKAILMLGGSEGGNSWSRIKRPVEFLVQIEALQNTTRLQEAAIQVERIRGALLLISGQQDRLWPATQMSHRIMERLQAREFHYPYEHVAYHTGHQGIIMNKDVWRKIFSFLADHYR